MSNNGKSAIEFACRLVLRPVASMFLKCGMTWKEFSELSKSIFVDAASREFGIAGRPTNVSRVSILTGISRKEVRRQRELLQAESSPTRGKTTDATRVLSGWFQDPEFLDAGAQPLVLAESADEGMPSFESLCRRYGGDIAATTMLKELLATQTVSRETGGRFRVLKRFYQPALHDDENLRWASSLIGDLASTMNNNVFPGTNGSTRFGRMADNDRIPSKRVRDFHSFLDRKGQAFLEEIDDWLTENAAADDDPGQKFTRVGVGLFAIQDAQNKERQK